MMTIKMAMIADIAAQERRLSVRLAATLNVD
jgi:hypothetical protein